MPCTVLNTYTLCTVPCSQKPIIGSCLHITGLSCEATFNISLISATEKEPSQLFKSVFDKSCVKWPWNCVKIK